MRNLPIRRPFIYAITGFSFFMLAHMGFNLLHYGINRSVGFPIHINYMHTNAYCDDIAAYGKEGGWEEIYHFSWLALMILYPLIGYFLVKKRKTELSFWNWLGVFMLIVPLYNSVQTFAERIFYALRYDRTIAESVSAILTPKLIPIYIISVLIAIYTFFKLLYKKERILLLLISFPVYVVTYYSWFYVWGWYVMPTV
ncbi:MAG: hypothetical protein H6551_12250 [Chitinophagales bacterium]|nr:hypothetical protein [Chitinophagaceae bacterium]MCB9065901.1 hypothetical protein [Chitinophagales bacterium]